MSFVALQDSLRKEVRKRIDAGELTGMELARRTGFTQAHISNFLNRKRGLKLSALDRMLKALDLTLYDLLDPHDVARFAAVGPGASEDYVDVPLVDGITAATCEVIVREQVKELIKLRRVLLNRLRAELAVPARKSWTRFVLLRLDPRDAPALAPRLAPGSLLLVDRHYTTLRPYQRELHNLYAVRVSAVAQAGTEPRKALLPVRVSPPALEQSGWTVRVRYVEQSGSSLVLRPHNPDFPADVLPLSDDVSAAHYIVGRIAHASLEL